MANVQAMPHPEQRQEPETVEAMFSNALREKKQAMAAIQSDLAELHEMEVKAGQETENSAEAITAFARRPVMQASEAIAGGLADKAEINETLIKAFGRGDPSPKTGKPSKSPSKRGMYYRKRIVTLSEAMGIADRSIEPEAFPRWAQGKEVEDIAEIIEALREGENEPFTAYSKLTEKERQPKAPLAFDVKALAKLAGDIANGAERINESDDLKKVYGKIAANIAELIATA